MAQLGLEATTHMYVIPVSAATMLDEIYQSWSWTALKRCAGVVMLQLNVKRIACNWNLDTDTGNVRHEHDAMCP
jgi:hypothetical protein